MLQLLKLCHQVTPIGGTCIDLYNGSGTTGIACAKEGFSYIGIEMNKKYCDISIGRINEALRQFDCDITCTLETLAYSANDPEFNVTNPAA
ncbi:DNA methyltransferase [Litorilituus sediminis]|uniref:DNA methyltransferase n=1 Tax=Litorilituus sediminis TaxID=718192 RepID=UPI00319E1A23